MDIEQREYREHFQPYNTCEDHRFLPVYNWMETSQPKIIKY